VLIPIGTVVVLGTKVHKKVEKREGVRKWGDGSKD